MSNTRLRLTLSQKIEILDQFAMGNTNQIELGKWAQQKFDLIKPLSQQTVSNILSNADQLYSNIVAIKNSKSLKLPKYPQLDEEVEKFVSHMNDCSIPVNRACIIEYVKRIARSKYSITEDITFSDGWLSKVFKRLGLKCRPTHGECASVDVNSKSIQDHLEKIREELTDYPLADIMNFDETGLYYNQPPRRTICSQPLGGLKKSKTRVTVGLLCNADGTYKGHPIVIGQFKSPRCFKENPKMLSMTAIGTRRYVEYHHSPKAWMTTEIFSAYVKKLDIAFGREGRISYSINALRNCSEKNKPFKWTAQQDEALKSLKTWLTSSTILHTIDMNKRIYIETDASHYAYGVLISQRDELGRSLYITFASKTFGKHEMAWSVNRKETYAIVYAFKKYRSILWGHPDIVVLTDHRSLVFMNTATHLCRTLQNYKDVLSEFKYRVEYIPGFSNTFPDILSRLYPPEVEDQILREDEEKKHYGGKFVDYSNKFVDKINKCYCQIVV
ncbi:hypothetical protein INT47_010338 [Mucor saturninus]|uniref:HTH CENPB-type domain-containing protein n=1 Tax=Mucor saturninus TaxID=64648 RepID=A0A8H7QF79_9FUNG|nr:hypothetical protein INT47_010338 [Mucor saturninus]